MLTETSGKVRVAVLVSGGGTNLQALIDAGARGELPSVEFALVVSNIADAYALERAGKAGIPAFAIPKSEYPKQRDFEARLRELLTEYRIDMIVLAGFLKILTADFVRDWPQRIINIHPALIPSFCGKGMYGLHVHEAVLSYGVKVTGATVHYVNEIPDGGQILEQKAVRVRKGDTPEVLQKRVMRCAEWKILPACTEKVAKKLLTEKE